MLRPQGEGWVVGELRNVGVPPLLRQVIDSRVARLGAEHRDLLAVAAVIGQEVPLGLWGAICELAEEDLLPTVDLAIAANLLESRADGVSVRFVMPWSGRRSTKASFRCDGGPGIDGSGCPGCCSLDPIRTRSPTTLSRLATTGLWSGWFGRVNARSAPMPGRTPLTAPPPPLPDWKEMQREPGERGWLLYRVGRLLRLTAREGNRLLGGSQVAFADAVDDHVLAAYALTDQGTLRCFVNDLRRGLAEMAAGADALDSLPTESIHIGGDVAAWVADALPEPAHARLRSGNTVPARTVNLRRGALVVWLASAGYFGEAEKMGAIHLGEFGERSQLNEAMLSSMGDIHLALHMSPQ